jgi:hypothetical protein
MSTKTIKQRIAIVAASALTAGFLSVIVTPTANAAVAAGDVTLTTATTSPGICYVDSTAGAQTATLTTGRTFVLTVNSGGSNEAMYFGVSGSVRVNAASFAGTGEVVTESAAYIVGGTYATNARESDTVTIEATSVGAGTVSIKPSSTGSAVEVITFNVVTSCSSNALSLADSSVQVRNDANGATGNNDEADGLTVANAGTSYINLNLVDVYSNSLTGAGVLAASATAGAVINWESAPSVQSSVAYSATRGATGTELWVTQGTANKDKPITTTVSITLDGVAVSTKTIKFQGVPSAILVKDITVGKTGSDGYFKAKVQDSAGNDLASKVVSGSSLENSAAAVAAIVSAVDPATSGADGDYSALADGKFSCTKGGVTTLTLSTPISTVSGTYVKKAITVACGGALDTWTISMDKAVYAPGEIATLTVTGKDSLGNLVNTTDTMNGAGVAIEYSFGGMTMITAPTGGDKFSSAAGAKTYTLTVGQTEGAFVGSFKIAGATDTAAKTVQYKVQAGTATVSNADVLKSIVALIASINKQIQALQKLILKR